MITPKKILQNITLYPEEPALSFKDSNGIWLTNSWSEYGEYTFQIAKSLIAIGIDKNDKIAIYSYNRKEWFCAYAATLMIGGVAVSVYHTCSSHEVDWIVTNSESKIVFVGNNPNDNDEQDKMPIHRIGSLLEKLKNVESIIMMDNITYDSHDHDKIMTWKDFIDLGKEIDQGQIVSRIEKIKETDTASLIYTSGTTGSPKGVELMHGNWSFEVEKLIDILPFQQGARYVSWLPLAHVFGQLVDNHFSVNRALHMHVVDNPLNIVDYAKEVKPHLFVGVPRIYEKIYSNLKSAINSNAIIRIGLKTPLLSSILKKKLKNATGFSNVRYAGSGAAPINPDILKLFQSLRIPLYEGYGMTENSAVATMNFSGHNKIGTVGIPLDNTEVKISDADEILIRGNHVMKGYYNNQEATNETLVDGWLHTGDIGAIDADGYLRITGRKKEIYVSSGG